MKISIMGQVLDKSGDLVKFLFNSTIKLFNEVKNVFGIVFEVFLPKIKNVGDEIEKQEKQVMKMIFKPLEPSNSFFDTFRSLLPYQDKIIKKLVWDFKYYLKPYAMRFCSNLLCDELVAEMSDRVCTIPFSGPRLIVHCPSSTFFKGEKRFDHMKELLCLIEAQQNSDQPFFVVCTHAIVPRGMSNASTSKAQHLSSREERLILAQSRFILSKEFIKFFRDKNESEYENSIKSKNSNVTRRHTIYCIDDVTTTGATFAAVTKLFEDEFRDEKVEVRCIALSH